MIKERLEHLTDDGIMVVQFGELDFTDAPNRTAATSMTARKALEELGVKDPATHMIVSPYITNTSGDLSTIMLKRTPFTPAEVERLRRPRSRKVPLIAADVGARPTARRRHRAPSSSARDRRRGRRGSSPAIRADIERRSPTTRRSSGTSPASAT